MCKKCSYRPDYSFSSGLSGMSLLEEQLSAIKAVYEGSNVFAHWIWEEKTLLFVMEHELGIVSALVAIVQRSAFAETTCTSVHQKLLQLLMHNVIVTFIYFSLASESRVAKNIILLQRMSCGLARFNEGPGWCSDERGSLLRGYYQFHVKQNNYIYPQYMVY